MMFKVVCIKSVESSAPVRIPRPGEVFTVRSEYFCPYYRVKGYRFEEIALPSWPCGMEWGFTASHFRRLVEKSTDTGMAILKEILERETVRDPVHDHMGDAMRAQIDRYRKLRDAMKNR